MSAHRNPRRRSRHARSLGATAYRVPVAAGVQLTENPNRGKRGTAGLAYMDGFVAELAHASRKAYAPLTVVTPIVTDRRGRKLPVSRQTSTSYTI